MRAAILAIGVSLTLGLSGCTDMPGIGAGPAPGSAPDGAQQAYFTGYPERLFVAAGLVCDEPSQSVVRPNANEVRCESLPNPELRDISSRQTTISACPNATAARN